MDKNFEYYGRVLSSLLGFSRLISGQLESNKSYLKEINPSLYKHRENLTDPDVLKFTS